MKFIALAVFFLAVVAGAFAQDYSDLFAGFGPYLSGRASLRDPRSNRGPVVFPAGPEPNTGETSGVIVGASGYGFVAPGAYGFYRFY
ncbi:uncharacterized protein LOC105683649 [Athalia rosae]|uniref:uncharacterized protein LOC105683649 n=1 Tax=Athalia rosae TaxID=37344 RepID=UPI0020337BD0|nr:uncharacterized protein LOC105683649 [Athalia rosae]